MALRRKKDFINEMVDEHFLVKEAKKQNIENLPDVKELIAAARKKIIVSKLIELEVDKKVRLEPDEAQKYYEAHKDEFMTPLLLRASHILVNNEAEAQTIKKELQAGADFEELARSKSLDNTAIRGGDIGFFQKGQLLPEFEDVAFKMRKGEISDVFHTQFGYHVMKLTDRAEPALRDFKMVKGILEKQILNEKRTKVYKEFVQGLKKDAKVMIDEKVLEAIPSGDSTKS